MFNIKKMSIINKKIIERHNVNIVHNCKPFMYLFEMIIRKYDYCKNLI